MTAYSSPAQENQTISARTVIACTTGNVLEWYDFIIYGFLAALIGKQFFPSTDHIASLLSAFAVLAVGYGVRPIGSLIFGHFGDRIGRKPAMMASIYIMGTATFLIGCLPTYEQIGIWAAVLLVLLRIFQGIAVAGEYSSSAVLLVEKAPAVRRGYVGSWIAAACFGGVLLGSGVTALISNLLGDDVMQSWGWRLPFLIGGGIAVIGIFLRRHLTESIALASDDEDMSSPIFQSVKDHWRQMLTIIGINMPVSIGYFILFVYAVSYFTTEMHFSTAKAMNINTFSLLLITVLIPVVGYVSDLTGRRPALFLAQGAVLLFGWPLWYLMHEQSAALVLIGQSLLAVFNGVGWALTIPVMVETFPAKVRCTAAGFSYNLCLGLFGGTTPWIATYLVSRTSDDFAPLYYLLAATAISCIAIYFLKEMARKPLN
ncbi:MAG: MFS transporter [Proteobacteria bacterium]|nr:MFS transporter [Pseudomonadota bacterium]